MAISASSKILASDVTTALGTKIDTAGTGLSKSGTTLALATVVTAGNAGPTADATLSYGGTFTVPYVTYDAYGRVTDRTNRTMTMPENPSSGIGMSASTIKKISFSGTTATLPAGGTWFYITFDGGDSSHMGVGSGAGGSSIAHVDDDDITNAFAFRIA